MRPSRKQLHALSLVGLVGLGLAVPALAQPASGYPAACEASKITKGESDRAHTVFLSGKGFLDESNYDKAISYFKDAYTIDCSVHGILPIIATAYERKGDKASAISALEEYLRRVPAAGDREVVERRIKNLKDQLATAPPASASSTPVAPTSTVPTGATAPTGTAPPSGTDVAPTATGTGETPPLQPAHSTTPWIVAGAGGVVLVAGVVMFIAGSGDVSSAEKTCPIHDSCGVSSAVSTGNTGRILEGVGIGAGIAGVLGLAGGLVWHFLEKPQTSASGGLQLTPQIAPRYGGLGLGGSF